MLSEPRGVVGPSSGPGGEQRTRPRGHLGSRDRVRPRLLLPSCWYGFPPPEGQRALCASGFAWVLVLGSDCPLPLLSSLLLTRGLPCWCPPVVHLGVACGPLAAHSVLLCNPGVPTLRPSVLGLGPACRALLPFGPTEPLDQPTKARPGQPHEGSAGCVIWADPSACVYTLG